MYDTCLASKMSFRTRCSVQYPFNDYAHYSNERNPFVSCSSQRRTCCCSCCGNSGYRVPIAPIYCYSLYGLRQSSLIQRVQGRKLISSSFNRRSDVNRSFYRNEICDLREINVGVRKRVLLRKCVVFEEIGENYDDEAEIMLSLLTGEVDEDSTFRVRKGTERSYKKPPTEKKRIDLCILERGKKSEYEPLALSSRKEDNERIEKIRKEDEREALFRRENLKSRASSSRKEDNKRIERTRKEDERDALLRRENVKAMVWEENRKENRKFEEKRERESSLRKENWNETDKEREELLRREEHRQKVRRDGSNCTSYYSFSSTGDYESDDELEVEEERIVRESSSGYKRDSRSNNEIVSGETREHDQLQENYEEEEEDNSVRLAKNKNEHESRVFESDFRRKSEKKLTDISIEELEKRKQTSQKDSKFSTVQESGYKNSSDSYTKYDGRKVKSSEGNKSTQSEIDVKYKHMMEESDARRDDVRASQKIKIGKDELSSNVRNSRRKEVEERRTATGFRTKEEEYQRNSRKVDEASKIQEIDMNKTSISQKRTESSVLSSIHDNETRQQHYDEVSKLKLAEKEDFSIFKGGQDSTGEDEYRRNRRKIFEASKKIQEIDTNKTLISQKRTETSVHSSIHDTEKRRQQYDEVSKLKLASKGGQNSKLIEQEESVNLASGSSLGSKERRTSAKKEDSKNRFGKSSNISTIYSGNSGAVVIEEETETNSDTIVESSSSHLGAEGSLSVNPTAGNASSNSSGETLEFGSSVSHGRLERSPDLRQESFGVVETHEEDAFNSAARFDKSSSHHVGEFIEKARNEISSSKIQTEKINREQKSLVQDASKDSESKGPSIEKWSVNEPFVQEQQQQEGAEITGNAIVKRSGKSLWNTISDIVRLRWSTRTASQSTSGKLSPNKSMSSDTFYEAEENEGEKSSRKTSSRFEEGSSSSTLPNTTIISTPQINLEITPSTSSTVPLPAIRLQRSPVVSENRQLNTGSKSEPDSEVKRRKFQRKDQIVKDRFDEWEEAHILETEQRKSDEMFMREALLEAQKAGDNWEVPVGAVLVHGGKIIARGCNLVEELRDSTAHAEMICIREASNILQSWRLSETTLYVTLEPCPMCAGAIFQARVDTVVWGAPNKLLGADGSWIRLFPNGDGGNGFEQSDKSILSAPVHPFHPKITIRRGVLASECADTMQQFFQLRRKRKKDKKTESPTTSTTLPISHHPSKFLSKMHDAFNIMFCL